MRLLPILFVMLSIAGLGQDLDFNKKTNELSVDGQLFLSAETIGKVGRPGGHINILDKTGERIARLDFKSFESPMAVSKSNPEGTVRYYVLTFVGLDLITEIAFMGSGLKRVSKGFFEMALMVDGLLDEERVREFVAANGTPFSDRVQY